MNFQNLSWYCFFSRTGQEIVDLSKLLRRAPDKIITNAPPDKIVPELYTLDTRYIIRLSERPTVSDYFEVLPGLSIPCIITLHGWLRVVPEVICKAYRGMIFNGHPGLITKYPELKGINPQQKAYQLKLLTSGSVVHEVTPEVDEGKILTSKEVPITGLTLDDIYTVLRQTSLSAWEEFFNTVNIVDTRLSII